ncbi:hypothetical protein GW17_00055808, partial [Ensete ventricosum]
ACEWAKDGIRANCVAPGCIRTPGNEQLLEDEEFVAKESGRVPLGRVGEAEEVAAVTAFLCLPASSYVTGQVIAIAKEAVRAEAMVITVVIEKQLLNKGKGDTDGGIDRWRSRGLRLPR